MPLRRADTPCNQRAGSPQPRGRGFRRSRLPPAQEPTCLKLARQLRDDRPLAGFRGQGERPRQGAVDVPYLGGLDSNGIRLGPQRAVATPTGIEGARNLSAYGYIPSGVEGNGRY